MSKKEYTTEEIDLLYWLYTIKTTIDEVESNIGYGIYADNIEEPMERVMMQAVMTCIRILEQYE